jgi:hypothetical protein
MKSFIFLVLILIIAWLTLPGEDQFHAYLVKKDRGSQICKDGTRLSSYKVLSIAHVDYCPPATNDTMQKRTDKYLGLFGTFWKLSD